MTIQEAQAVVGKNEAGVVVGRAHRRPGGGWDVELPHNPDVHVLSDEGLRVYLEAWGAVEIEMEVGNA